MADLAEQILTDQELASLIETEEKARRVWQHYPELRREFSGFSTFWAYLQAFQQGRVKIYRGNGVTQSQPPA